MQQAKHTNIFVEHKFVGQLELKSLIAYGERTGKGRNCTCKWAELSLSISRSGLY